MSNRKQQSHIVDGQLGGTERKRLPVLLPSGFEFRDDIPETRADCPKTRPCPHVHCEHNTWMVTGLDRQGRRRIGYPLPPATIRVTVTGNCAVDYADRVEAGNDVPVTEVAATLGVTDRQVRRLQASALEKLGLNFDADPRVVRDALRAVFEQGRR